MKIGLELEYRNLFTLFFLLVICPESLPRTTLIPYFPVNKDVKQVYVSSKNRTIERFSRNGWCTWKFEKLDTAGDSVALWLASYNEISSTPRYSDGISRPALISRIANDRQAPTTKPYPLNCGLSSVVCFET
ncbi:hypothetical protein NPIL_394961 [Nephila pilipes]|uniref:Uncharacterized protein n=1 Tax=Nephila pilipes TaxID=299642 RepID=A0A8X6NC87_NEPPI|nr:hypothetical protein NPIL_394961 [Nephila pilipes]